MHRIVNGNRQTFCFSIIMLIQEYNGASSWTRFTKIKMELFSHLPFFIQNDIQFWSWIKQLCQIFRNINNSNNITYKILWIALLLFYFVFDRSERLQRKTKCVSIWSLIDLLPILRIISSNAVFLYTNRRELLSH